MLVGKLDSTEGSADTVWKYHTILACSWYKFCLGKVLRFEDFLQKRIAIYCVLVAASFLVIFKLSVNLFVYCRMHIIAMYVIFYLMMKI